MKRRTKIANSSGTYGTLTPAVNPYGRSALTVADLIEAIRYYDALTSTIEGLRGRKGAEASLRYLEADAREALLDIRFIAATIGERQ